MAYRILNLIEATQVPDWNRRPRKWGELIDLAIKLAPGKTVPILFDGNDDNLSTANMARNAVRDTVNLKLKGIATRTRVVENDDKTATLYITRLTLK